MKKRTITFLSIAMLLGVIHSSNVLADDIDITTPVQTSETIPEKKLWDSSIQTTSSLDSQNTESTDAFEETIEEPTTTVESSESMETTQSTEKEILTTPPYQTQQINALAKLSSQEVTGWKSVETLPQTNNTFSVSNSISISNHVYQVTEHVLFEDNTSYYKLIDLTQKTIGYVSKSEIVFLKEPQVIEKYFTFTETNTPVYRDLNLTQVVPTTNILNKTFFIKEKLQSWDDKYYFSLVDFKNQLVGYMEVKNQKLTDSPLGIEQKFTGYANFTKQNQMAYKDNQLKISVSTNSLLHTTYRIKGTYRHFDGTEYVSLETNNTESLYTKKENIFITDGQQGQHYSYGKYVTIKANNYMIWGSFNWEKRDHSSNYQGEVLQARGYYNHFNGARYLTVYDNQGKWIGYINETGTELSDGRSQYHAYDKYVTIKASNYTIWQDFNWKKREHSSNYQGEVLQARGYYDHFNGQRYLTVYDNQGKWIGYINQTGTEVTPSKVGSFHSDNKYVAINANNYTIWQDFNWKKRADSASYYGQALQSRGYYQHFNGTRYLTLYDNQGKWVGYLSEKGTQRADNKMGLHHHYGKKVVVTGKNHTIWQNFNWQKRAKSSTYFGQTVTARGYYDHFNGDRYLTIYDDNGHWIGYINETGTSLTKGAGSYLGINRSNILNELNNNSSMYLNTPFRGSLAIPASVMSPIGNPNQYGPGFNCTGFIATALRNSGANINKVANATNGIGGVANAYNWRDALTANTDYYTFYSVDALLQSGKAKKGDLIYFEADFTKPNYDCHIGFFWGDTPSQNRFWHSTLAAGGNKITHIFSGTPFSKILLIPMD
ncbi:hypothetical protein DOK78_001516 [Enterococcus sp. DIV2402]|uniref:NlpC/P60 domain-containing protein n=1 Tax=Candidatus Enterococcus lowellii TaxID=2230877 RepID=A0ABZ2SSJ6_9ENTE|nr:hypothetical protein [Enterococcus sp. DIV2402]MBO0464295.1 hypothetical protein [Enterococcus sp. DIV2402]